MKQALILLCALVCAAALCACAAGSKAPAAPAPETAAPTAALAQTPEPVITEAPAPVETAPPSVETEEPAPEPTGEPEPEPVVLNPKNDAYFDDALFIGDSIMEGIRQYVAKCREETPTLGEAKFLTSVAGIGVIDLVGDRHIGRYYAYKGVYRPLEEIVAEIAPGRIFLLLGLNDLAEVKPSVDDIAERYFRLIDLLQELFPDAEIVVLTNPPRTASAWLPDYTPNRSFGNALIDAFVEALIGGCEARGIPYVDIHGALADENGALPEEWSRDQFVQLSNEGAQVVVDTLYAFASDK